MRRAAAIVGILLAVAAMTGGGIFIASVLRPEEASCGTMASRAAKAAQDARRVEVVISLASNNSAAAGEASSFVVQALSSVTPGDQTVARITLVVGARAYKPSGSACFGTGVLMSASDADLRNYKDSTSDAREDLEAEIVEQYTSQVAQVADQVASAVRSAPPPSADIGAFFIWPFVAEAPADRNVYVLGSFTTGGNNCLTFDDPTATSGDGRNAFLTRVQECVRGRQVEVAAAKSVRLSAAQALDLTGGQKQAQRAVMDALCAAAASGRCVVDGGQQPSR